MGLSVYYPSCADGLTCFAISRVDEITYFTIAVLMVLHILPSATAPWTPFHVDGITCLTTLLAQMGLHVWPSAALMGLPI